MHQLEAEAAQLMLMHAEMDVSLSSWTHMVDKWKERYAEIRDSLSSHLQPEDWMAVFEPRNLWAVFYDPEGGLEKGQQVENQGFAVGHENALTGLGTSRESICQMQEL